MFGLSLPHIIVLLIVILLVFGTKKLRTLGSDLGESIKGFKKAMSDDEKQKIDSQTNTQPDADFSKTENQTSSTGDKKE